MNYILATNDKQLGICLRMLFAEDLRGYVDVVMTKKNKIEFHIGIDVNDVTFEMLRKRYEILIS